MDDAGRVRAAALGLACLLVPSIAWARSTCFNFNAGDGHELRCDATRPARTLATIGNWTCVAGAITEGVNLHNKTTWWASITCTHTGGARLSVGTTCMTEKDDFGSTEATIGEPGRRDETLLIHCTTLNVSRR
jgi:hypothetical protein